MQVEAKLIVLPPRACPTLLLKLLNVSPPGRNDGGLGGSAIIELNRNIIDIKTLGALNNVSSYFRPPTKGKRKQLNQLLNH